MLKCTIFGFIILVIDILSHEEALEVGELSVVALFCFKNGNAAGQRYSCAFKKCVKVPHKTVQIVRMYIGQHQLTSSYCVSVPGLQCGTKSRCGICE